MKCVSRFAAAGIVVLLLVSACHHRRRQGEKTVQKELTPVSTLYAKGQKALEKGKPMTARRYFDQIILREDAGEYKDRATIATADSFMAEHTMDTYSEAISRYQSFLAFHPTHPQAAYCQYQIGRAYFEEVDTPDRDITPAQYARRSFQALIDNYPSSPYAAKAKNKLTEVDNILAAHEIKVGDWYLKSGHYKGAVGRYRYVLKKYPKYWNIPLVHYRLAEALRRDGQVKEAAVYFKLVKKEAPGTKLAKNAANSMERLGKREEKRRKHQEEKVLDEPLVQGKSRKRHWWQFWKW